MIYLDVSNFLIPEQASLKEALQVIDRNREGVGLVVDSHNRLLGVITDGDARRFMLKGHALDNPCTQAMCANPLMLPVGTPQHEIELLCAKNRLRHIPLVDENKIIRNIMCLSPDGAVDHAGIAVIMAGGEGKRLRPITEEIPKPMIQIKGRPLLEIIIEKLKWSGFNDFFLAVNYKANIIKAHFKDGAEFGVSIRYLHEEKKLGTAGALSLLPTLPEKSFLVMNSDIITDIDFQALADFHLKRRSFLTIAAIQYNMNVPFGVIEHSGSFVLSVQEKPAFSHLCNAGIYMLDPLIVSRIPRDKYYDMPSLVHALITDGLTVHAFPIHESWIDIGHQGDLLQIDDSYEGFFNNPNSRKKSR